MKKIAICLVILISFSGCGEELEFNSPAVQGNLNGDLWRANSSAADIDFGGFLIQGVNNRATLQLLTVNDALGTYNLGGNDSSIAIVRDANGLVYSTANDPDPDFSPYPAEGQIIIEQVNGTNPTTISGRFWFYAFTSDGSQTLNFNEGVFYRVPVAGGLVLLDNEEGCEQATQQVSDLETIFDVTDSTMPNYADVCNAYKTALVDQIAICGDSDGALQNIVDNLEDCSI